MPPWHLLPWSWATSFQCKETEAQRRDVIVSTHVPFLPSLHTGPLPMLPVMSHVNPPTPKPSFPSFYSTIGLCRHNSLSDPCPAHASLTCWLVNFLIPLAYVWRHPTQYLAQRKLSFLEWIKAHRPYLHFLSVEYCNFAGDGGENRLYSFIVLLQSLGNSFWLQASWSFNVL